MEQNIITSRQNPIVKDVCGLAEKKNREKNGLFRFDGFKLFSEAIDARMALARIIYREDVADRANELISEAIAAGCCTKNAAVCVSASVFEKISEERAPEGVICVARMPRELHRTYGGDVATLEGERLLLAESLRDPGNLGTVMRSCFALGIDRLILTSDCADIYNSKTVRAAMGAIFKLDTTFVSPDELVGVIETLRSSGRRVYAAALAPNAVTIDKAEIAKGDCFVIGNEGHGLSADVVSACTAPVIIPMREGAESLNAAAAAAICIWETVKSAE